MKHTRTRLLRPLRVVRVFRGSWIENSEPAGEPEHHLGGEDPVAGDAVLVQRVPVVERDGEDVLQVEEQGHPPRERIARRLQSSKSSSDLPQ